MNKLLSSSVVAGAIGPVLEVGESVVWDEVNSTVWAVDIWGRSLHRLSPATGRCDVLATNEMACAVVVGSRGFPVLALERCLMEARIDEGRLVRIAEGPLPEHHRFNDAVVDAAGRLLIGSMRLSALGSDERGQLLLYDGSWKVLLDGFRTINGLAFSPDGATLYMSDSHPEVATIWKAPYDLPSGKVGRRVFFATLPPGTGRPDGATVDAIGNYWIAGVGGGTLHCLSPEGRPLGQLALPVDNPTRPAFGGESLETLYVTTMSIRQSREDPERLAGRTLVISGAGCGLPSHRFGY